jgi:hypothetical protein
MTEVSVWWFDNTDLDATAFRTTISCSDHVEPRMSV